jgi:nucleotide-binding universal stress UspA family protein
MFPIRRILHPTDFSNLSKAAFEVACALARDYNAELVITHVVPPPAVYAPDGIAMPMPVEEPYEARATLAQIRPADPRVKFEHKLLEGTPAHEILKYANETRVDLIVLGTHGSSGLGRLLMGSVAEDVLRKASCPVLTVKAPVPIESEPNVGVGMLAPAP